MQARWDELKSEMEGLREEGRKAWDERNGLFEKRNELQKQMVSPTVRLVVERWLMCRRRTTSMPRKRMPTQSTGKRKTRKSTLFFY